jgi:hypothetical protein
MNERTFRLILGAMLYLSLTLSALLESEIPMYVVLGLISFEAITNWRVPIIVTRLRYGKDYKNFLDTPLSNNRLLGIVEAERFLRIAVIGFVILPYFFSIQYIEFIPWFVATALILAGVTNICPMVMFLRFIGMR